MLDFQHMISLLAVSQNALVAVRAAVETYNGPVSDRNVRIEKEEKSGSGTWVTIAVSSAEQAFHLGVRTGQLLKEEGGVEIG